MEYGRSLGLSASTTIPWPSDVKGRGRGRPRHTSYAGIALANFFNPASACLSIIAESALDVVSEALLFLSRKLQSLCSFFRSRQGCVGQLQPAGSISSDFLFFLLASELRHLEQVSQGRGNLALFRMFGILQGETSAYDTGHRVLPDS
jgi:hypothetical protein